MSEALPQRIGDADRDQAANCLREHLAQGRLSSEEFDERLSSALSAKTAADLEPLFADLPDPRPSSLGRSPEMQSPIQPPWPAYPSPQDPTGPNPIAANQANVPAARPPAQQPAMSGGVSNAIMIAAGVAWPVWLLISFATQWRYTWLIALPIIISIIAGTLRRQSNS